MKVPEVTASLWSLRAWAVAASIGLVVGIVFAIAQSNTQTIPFDQIDRITACRKELMGWMNANTRDLQTAASIHGICYVRTNEEDQLRGFGLLETALLRQQQHVPFLMWMVIAITISGVVLAGLQLVGSYRLASAGRANFEQGGEISIERNRMALSTSVTGVLILVISLGFFYVFVKEVYLLKPLDVKPPEKSSAPAPDFTAGWLSRQTTPPNLNNGAPVAPEAVGRLTGPQPAAPAANDQVNQRFPVPTEPMSAPPSR
jgi:NADH:ubiquinone oxidoreductase subunit 3 (subunit A)